MMSPCKTGYLFGNIGTARNSNYVDNRNCFSFRDRKFTH